MNARWMMVLAACSAAAFLGATPVNATEPNAGGNMTPGQGLAQVTPISNLMGATVLYPQIQKLGQIKEALLDPQSGQVAFIVLDAVIPGSDHALLVVPYQALQVSVNPSNNAQSVVLNVRSDQLRNAPRVQKGDWRSLQNPQFLEQARNFYQPRTYTAARPIENAGTTSTGANPAAARPGPVCPPQPFVNSGDWAGWPQDLIDFYNE